MTTYSSASVLGTTPSYLISEMDNPEEGNFAEVDEGTAAVLAGAGAAAGVFVVLAATEAADSRVEEDGEARDANSLCEGKLVTVDETGKVTTERTAC